MSFAVQLSLYSQQFFECCSQLASIIWGESKETDDHIVPHPEENEDHQKKKEWNQETAPIKPTEEKILGLKIDFDDSKTGSSANINKKRCLDVSAFGSDSWPNLSPSNAVTNDTQTIDPRYGSFKGGENILLLYLEDNDVIRIVKISNLFLT